MGPGEFNGSTARAELEKILVSASTPRFWRWRKRLFIFLQATMVNATEFFRIPSNRVVELGGQIEI